MQGNAYRETCIKNLRVDEAVRRMIAGAAAQAHEAMEGCLDRVLSKEGWGRKTWRMLPGLRIEQDRETLGRMPAFGSARRFCRASG